MKIFIVDDSEIVRARLLMMLADIAGAEVVGQAREGRTALEKIHTLQPEIVILDVQLPDIDGIEILKKIKQQHPSIIVIMFTNYPYLVVKIKSLGAGADYF